MLKAFNKSFTAGEWRAYREALTRRQSGIRRMPIYSEQRPWGSFHVLDEAKGYKVKRIVVKEGGRLSLQSHKHRAEHWTVVEGTATITVDDKVMLKTRGGAVCLEELPEFLSGRWSRSTNSINCSLLSCCKSPRSIPPWIQRSTRAARGWVITTP